MNTVLIPTDGSPTAEQAIERQCDPAGVSFEGHRREGDPTAVIRSLANEIDPDLIAMGATGGTGLSRRLLGSTTVGVLRDNTAPVLAVPGNAPDTAGEYDTILLATDGSKPAGDSHDGIRVGPGL